MVDWKIYIDSPQQRALDLCRGSLAEDDGYGTNSGWGYSYTAGDGRGNGYGDAVGDGYGYANGFGYGNCYGNGRSVTKW